MKKRENTNEKHRNDPWDWTGGRSERHMAQLIRGKMIQREHKSVKNYTRKIKHKGNDF